MFGNSGAAQARTMQQPQQPPVQPLNSSQPSLRAQVPQFLSPQVRQHFHSRVFPYLELFHIPSPLHMHSVVPLRLCSSCLPVSVLIYFLASKHITWVRSSSVYTLYIICVGTLSCFFFTKSSVSRELSS